ncbi:50S ribosomal protein L36e [Saprolegnia diclina VS20]|uniref:60S ribosomal protein L36 n=2 Tax=Saprolegnia TaxID=4769 RepID=A0A067CS45_SAPPC|nr:50S ribosomal protein L36e [Saprolegnia diclina VS20]XP_012196068.1 50S ribosomal protein L36e [Saprolegnia parasitica CBS 223.65]EQC31293.1 50S ribosomal protein L36e [Saprolegnia diclina VS20]KDO33318.1 50S ribosomal protein L36e [Saprolegnia parasitica CBS 223.65]|eukprot:XP_008615134.1 50S ribosomal protein L36e [Saprolegnia diclina VS20]
MSSTGIACGVAKGYPVTKREVAPRPAAKKGRAGKKTQFVRNIVREVVGLMPYEKRILDMIKSGGSSAEKRIYKFTKKRLGTHRRALHKREEMKAYYAAVRAKQAGI